MALFAVRVEDSPVVNKWYAETLERSQQDSLVQNPFKWRWKKFRHEKKLLLVCEASPVIPNFCPIFWLSAVGVLVVWGVNPVFWILIGLGLCWYFWTSAFYYHMTWVALRRKQKYRGVFKRVKLSDVVREVVL